MVARDAIARALMDLPAGLVRWGSAPAEQVPRLPSGVATLDAALGGGWPRGKVCVLWSPEAARSTGRTAIASATVAAATAQGYLAAWVDGDASLDPGTLAASGADLSRVLWVRGPDATGAAVEEVLRARGFEAVVVRPPGALRPRDGTWVRIARAAERSRSVVLVLGDVGASAAPGAVRMRVGDLAAEWTPGPGPPLLGGARCRAGVDSEAAQVRFGVG